MKNFFDNTSHWNWNQLSIYEMFLGVEFFAAIFLCLRQGIVFTPVCDSVHRGRGLCPSMHHRSHDQRVSVRGGSVRGGLCLSTRVFVQGSLRGSLSRGSLLNGGGLCPRGSLSRGVSVRGDPLYSNEQAVCILLECILVVFKFSEFVQLDKCFSQVYYMWIVMFTHIVHSTVFVYCNWFLAPFLLPWRGQINISPVQA